MLRTNLVLLIIAALSLGACGDKPAADDAPGKPEGAANGAPAGGDDTAPSGDVVLAYTPPADWKVITRPSDYVLSMAYPADSGDAHWANVQLAYNSIWVLKDKSLEGAATAMLGPYKRMTSTYKDFKVESSKTVTIGAVTAKEIHFSSGSWSGADHPFKGRMWVAVSKSYAYSLIAAFSAAEYDKLTTVLDAVGKSLRWEAGTPSPSESD